MSFILYIHRPPFPPLPFPFFAFILCQNPELFSFLNWLLVNVFGWNTFLAPCCCLACAASCCL